MRISLAWCSSAIPTAWRAYRGGKLRIACRRVMQDVLRLTGDKRFLDQLSPSLGNGHRFPVMARLGEFGASRCQGRINLLFLS